MYNSKILLFGEYTILLNSQAFAIPYNRFKGDWAFIKDATGSDITKAKKSNQRLKRLLTYLIKVRKDRNQLFTLETDSFEKDLENGTYFKSDIPEGCGLGSSGALVAAIFNKYSGFKTGDMDILKLRNYLAFLESFFHGISSGIDPLVSYLNKPVYIETSKICEIINFPIDKLLKKFGLFIVNSQHTGKTIDRVNYFNNKCNSKPEYLNAIKKEYIPVNNACIKAITDTNNKSFFSLVQKLTRLQLILFHELIPENMIPLMTYGLENSMFYLKLCGSGGGYFSGFTENKSETAEYFKNKGHQIIFY